MISFSVGSPSFSWGVFSGLVFFMPLYSFHFFSIVISHKKNYFFYFFCLFPTCSNLSCLVTSVSSFLSTVILPPSDAKSNEQMGGLPVDIKLPVKHILSKELQVIDLLFGYIILLKLN